MKTRITIALLLLMAAGIGYARYIRWHENIKPPISLAEALAKAADALKPRHVDYYCLSATVAQSFSQCDWELHFAATNQTEIWVSVGTDKVRVSELGFDY